MKKREIVNNWFKENWNYIIGAIFFIWWVVDLSIKLRDIGSHEYLWFCSISLLLVAIAFFIKSSTLLLSTLSILLIFHLLWNFDFFYYIFKSKFIITDKIDLFGAGCTPIEFIDGLRHVFSIPFILLGIIYFGKLKKYHWILTSSILLILGHVSYFLTSFNENLNCSIRTCLSVGRDFTGLKYFYPYLIILIILCGFVIGPFLYKLFNKCYKNRRYMRILKISICLFFILMVIAIFLGSIKYSNINHYYCKNNNENIFCNGANSNMHGIYIKYNLRDVKEGKCNISVFSLEKVLNSTIKDVYKDNILGGIIFVPKPERNTYVRLEANCSNI